MPRFAQPASFADKIRFTGTVRRIEYLARYEGPVVFVHFDPRFVAEIDIQTVTPPGPERPHRAGKPGPERPHRAGKPGPERPHRAGKPGLGIEPGIVFFAIHSPMQLFGASEPEGRTFDFILLETGLLFVEDFFQDS